MIKVITAVFFAFNCGGTPLKAGSFEILQNQAVQAAPENPQAMPPAVPDEAYRVNTGGGQADAYNSLRWDRKYGGGWYEWWYYKVVVPETGDAFYFCYGVTNPWDVKQENDASRAFINVGSFRDSDTLEQAFRVKDFAASSTATFVQIGGNLATDRIIRGRLTAPDGGDISWDLTIEKDWGVNLMSWTMSRDWISNIYWYPAQAGARMSGTITYRGRSVTLNKAPAYQDRNWGTSYPKWWTWLVSNNFKGSPGTVLASGGGQPRIFPGVSFIQAVTIGLRHREREYLFLPTDGDKVSVDVNFGRWELSARNRRNERITISAYAPREKFLLLPFVTPQGKVFKDYEALTGHIDVKLFNGSNLIAELETDEGGIEFGSFASYDSRTGSPPGVPDLDALFSGKYSLQ